MKKVIVFGTFDYLHPGHSHFFSQAKKLGDYLIVVVATDQNVLKAKGSLPKLTQDKRLEAVLKLSEVDKAILGSETMDYITTLKEERPEFLALGYDQKFSLETLRLELKKNGLGSIRLVRLKPHHPHKYKSSLLN